jgi:hypothetical protein
MKEHIEATRLFNKVLDPNWVSFLSTSIFFFIYLFIFHPGYGINDDPKIISLFAGYPGGNPAPYFVNSNILIGLILKPFYGLHTSINWEILLFFAVNFLSMWGLLQIILSGSTSRRQQIVSGLVALACDAYFVLNITYTNIASFACLSGICLFFATFRSTTDLNKMTIACGTALIFISSLIRFETLPLILSMALPGVIVSRGYFKIKKLALGLIIPCVFVSGGYLFNRAYLHFLPDWHQYDIYNKTRVLIDDTHRFENMHTEIRFIGWSSNDQELFAHWFYPDQRIYSLGHLQYLVQNISGITNNKIEAAKSFAYRLITPGLSPYMVVILALGLWLLSSGFFKKAWLPLLAIFSICLAENLYLAWAWKIADRTIYSTVAAAVILGIVFMNWFSDGNSNGFSTKGWKPGIQRFLLYASALFAILSIGLFLNQSIQTTELNLNKKTAYKNILTDLDGLKIAGAIPPNSLIISPAHGLPLEWSNPFTLNFPNTDYLDTGWITFSPFYEHILQDFDIQSLPDALYKNNNIYLMTKSTFTVFLGRYYQEHENITVTFQPIYSMPNEFNIPGYDDIRLYKVVKLK